MIFLLISVNYITIIFVLIKIKQGYSFTFKKVYTSYYMILSSIVLGLLGTALMTFFMYLISYLTKREVKVVKILGTMVTFQTTAEKKLSDTTSAIFIGIISHYSVGVFFAFPYILLLHYNSILPTLTYSLLYGLLAGIVAMILWKTFFIIHPNPPVIPLKTYLLDLLIAHIIFGLGCWIGYKMILIPYSLL